MSETLQLREHSAHDDALARRVLQCAQGAFQKWPEGFTGFSARLRCGDDDREITGEARVFAGGRVEVALAHAVLGPWAGAALRAIAHARTPYFFKDGDGRFPMSFEPDDAHALGRRVRVHLGGGAWRTYRIDAKGRISAQENAEPSRRATVTYDELVRTSPGRVVPTRMRILDWDVATQMPLEAAEIEDAYRCVEHVVLPARRRAALIRGGLSRVRWLELDEHVVL